MFLRTDCGCTSRPQATKSGAPRSAAPGAYLDGQRLLWFDEAPPVLQFNKYVLSGYRAGERLAQVIHTRLLQFSKYVLDENRTGRRLAKECLLTHRKIYNTLRRICVGAPWKPNVTARSALALLRMGAPSDRRRLSLAAF